jgi:hypothetical protein
MTPRQRAFFREYGGLLLLLAILIAFGTWATITLPRHTQPDTGQESGQLP